MNYIRWFHEVRSADAGQVGDKAASLGEMMAAGLPVPLGFCLTAQAYRTFFTVAKRDETIWAILEQIRPDDRADIEAKTASIRRLIAKMTMPRTIATQVLDSYRHLARTLGAPNIPEMPVAVRFSAIPDGLPRSFFATQRETYLNVCGGADLLQRIAECWGLLWTPQAVAYRIEKYIDPFAESAAVVVQAMIPSEVSGVLFTAHPSTGQRDEALIYATWGLGEAIVSGLVTPDVIRVRKCNNRIISHQIGAKQRVVEHAQEGGTAVRATPAAQQCLPSLADDQVAALMNLGGRVEAHYGGAPMGISWAFAQGRFYLLEARRLQPLPRQATTAEAEGAPTIDLDSVGLAFDLASFAFQILGVLLKGASDADFG
ncbi:MAG: hypothetical protein IT330_15270 [Anaerolineae bacterium]|nr:hypothetical protein [Anaerolineae bacterium]